MAEKYKKRKKGKQCSLFSLSATVGAVFLGTVISHSTSSPAPDHLLQPSPSTPSAPYLQLRKQKQKQTKNPLNRGLRSQKGLRPL